MDKYRVYFNQINQTYFDVEADSKEEAIKKAKIDWKKNMGIADVSEVDKLKKRKPKKEYDRSDQTYDSW